MFGTRCIEIDDTLSLLNILNLPFGLHSLALFCSTFHEVDLMNCVNQAPLPFSFWLEKEIGNKEVAMCISLAPSLCVFLSEATAPIV